MKKTISLAVIACDTCGIQKQDGESWEGVLVKLPGSRKVRLDFCPECIGKLCDPGLEDVTVMVAFRAPGDTPPSDPYKAEAKSQKRTIPEGWREVDGGTYELAGKGRVELRGKQDWRGVLADGTEKKFGIHKGKAIKWVAGNSDQRPSRRLDRDDVDDAPTDRIAALKAAAAKQKTGRLASDPFLSR